MQPRRKANHYYRRQYRPCEYGGSHRHGLLSSKHSISYYSYRYSNEITNHQIKPNDKQEGLCRHMYKILYRTTSCQLSITNLAPALRPTAAAEGRRALKDAVAASGAGTLGLAEVEGDSLLLGLSEELMDADVDADSLELGLRDALADTDSEADSLAEGLSDADSLALSLVEVLLLGLIEADGEGVGDALLEGDSLAEGDKLGEALELGETDALGD